MAQFLTEAAVLTSLGGIIGTVTGIIFAEAINQISGVPVSISVPASIIAIAFSDAHWYCIWICAGSEGGEYGSNRSAAS